jgi:hypothetical protein
MCQITLRMRKKKPGPWGTDLAGIASASYSNASGLNLALSADGTYSRPPAVAGGQLVQGYDSRGGLTFQIPINAHIRYANNKEYLLPSTKVYGISISSRSRHSLSSNGLSLIHSVSAVTSFDLSSDYKPEPDRYDLRVRGTIKNSFSLSALSSGSLYKVQGEITGQLSTTLFDFKGKPEKGIPGFEGLRIRIPFEMHLEGDIGFKTTTYMGTFGIMFRAGDLPIPGVRDTVLGKVPLTWVGGSFMARGNPLSIGDLKRLPVSLLPKPEKLVAFKLSNVGLTMLDKPQLEQGADLKGLGDESVEKQQFLMAKPVPDPEDRNAAPYLRTIEPSQAIWGKFIGLGFVHYRKSEKAGMKLTLGIGAGLDAKNRPQIGVKALVISGWWK